MDHIVVLGLELADDGTNKRFRPLGTDTKDAGVPDPSLVRLLGRFERHDVDLAAECAGHICDRWAPGGRARHAAQRHK